jgi:hypothetical protein
MVAIRMLHVMLDDDNCLYYTLFTCVSSMVSRQARQTDESGGQIQLYFIYILGHTTRSFTVAFAKS